MLHFGVCFLILVFSDLCGLDLSDYAWGFKDNSFTFVVAFYNLPVFRRYLSTCCD